MASVDIYLKQLCSHICPIHLSVIIWPQETVGFLGGDRGKESACQCRRLKTQVRSLGQEDPLEKKMATHSSILAWRIPWTEEPGGLQSMGPQRDKLSMRTHITRD